ncbi:MAG: ParB N-terminal domain-containing protein [Novosphingobium sp.]|nr:ParB N-terminal domain-containing protein [Novosphingobium sp.]
MSTTCQVVERDISALRPYARNARTHSKKQIKQIARSIERFGFTNPVLVSDEGEIIAGHGRVEAAKLLGWKQVPTIALSHLSEGERRTYVLADNKLALNAGWDKEILAIELQALVDLEFDVEVKHREFAFASGEMSESQFTQFLRETLGNAASVMRDGAIAFVCMDWRHMGELLSAGSAVFTELKNLVVWNKTNGGMGAFYRSKHELIFVFKQGTAEHTNSFGLGETGRYRTNVWDYAGISSISGSRSEELAMHPTVKPVALIADAIRDCSRRGEVVLDCFGGSGSTLIAAEKTGRCARLIEYDPLYCDTIIRRWEKLNGKRARLSGTGDCFEDVAEQRLGLAIAGETV